MILMVKTKPTVLFKKKSILLIIVFLIGCLCVPVGKKIVLQVKLLRKIRKKYLPQRKQEVLRKKLQNSGKGLWASGG